MRNHIVASVAAVGMAVAWGACARAQYVPPPGAGLDHNIAGVWSGQIRANEVAPMTPEAQAKFDFNTRELKNDRPITIDPAYTCHPPGIPHAFNNGAYAMEIVQTPQRIFMFFESAHQWREIWIDGRKMPKDGDPLWNGYAIGHWDGDDLVVETGNFNDLTWLDAAGHPHSAEMKLEERYHLADKDTLQITFSVNDPKYYNKPWTLGAAFKRKSNWEVGEAFCVPEDQSNFEKHILEPNGRPTPASDKAAPKR